MLVFKEKKQPPVVKYRRWIALSILVIVFMSCHKEIEIFDQQELQANNSPIAAPETIIAEIPFSATASIAYCHGENIVFSGIIQNLVTTTTDEQGVIHYTRHFSTRGLTGVGSVTGTVYDVLGGAEMFSVKDAVLNANGTLNLSGSLSESDIVIHEGTLVLQITGEWSL